MTTQMTYTEYVSYASEITTLERLIAGLTPARHLERHGFEYRLERARAKIEGVPVPPKPKKLSVAFNGKPVIHSYGIDANFGTEAITAFSDSVRLTTAGRTGELSATGQIPRSELSQPIITNVAFGSFGFELELPTPDNPDAISEPELAVNQILELLRAANSGNDDDLGYITSSMHPRAVNKVTELLKLMQKNEAWFTMDYQGNTVRFQNNEEIEDAIKRLNPSNVEQQTRELIGTLIGIIPITRRFELHPVDQPPIHGAVGHEIRDPQRTAQQFTNQRVRAIVRTVRISREATSHTLIGVSRLPNSAGA